MVDWSRGADGVIGKQGINSIEDLAGKTVAFAPYTPSHFLLWNGLKTSGLSTEQRNEIFTKAVHTKDGIEPATLFAQEKVDAAVAWDPDMSDAVAKRPGSKKIYDTSIANRLIADILVVSDRFAAKHPQTVLKFAQGWLEGVEFIKTQPERAYNLIGTIKDFNIPSDLAKTMLGGVKLADYADNRSFMGTRRLECRLRQHPWHGPGDVSRADGSLNTRSIRKRAWIGATSRSWPTVSPWRPAKRRSNTRSPQRAQRRSPRSIGPSTSIPIPPA